MNNSYSDYPGKLARVTSMVRGRPVERVLPLRMVSYLRCHPTSPLLEEEFLARLSELLRQRTLDEEWLLEQLSKSWPEIDAEGLGYAIDAIFLNVENPQSTSRKIGRNELCPCGSGLKYKKCCLRAGMKISML